jgi:hypothetical protein
VTARVRWPFAWLRKERRRDLTKTQVEKLIDSARPGESDLDRLRWLLDWIFRESPYSHRKVIARARRRGVRPDRVDRLRAGDVGFGFRWDLIEIILEECGAPVAAVEVAHDLFHNFPRVGTPHPELARSPWAALSGTAPTRSGTRPRSDDLSGQHCSVLLLDVVGFGKRPDQDRKIIREVMYRIVQHAFTTAEIQRNDYYREDRGDGMLIVIPPHVPTKRVVHPVLTAICAELSRHNADTDEGTRFVVRVALDVGPVESDVEGVNGQVIIDAARLIDAPSLRRRLANAPREISVAFIASDHVYRNVIKQHPGQLAPDRYQEIKAQVKESRFTAWISLGPDARAPASDESDP